jgi:serine/threonine protein kinase
MAADPLIGTELGDYAIRDRLGAGGMGIVYRAENLALRRPVALKVLPTNLLDDATARHRFQREIQTAVALEHPNIVPVYDAGYEGGSFYIAMRLIDGPDLATVIAGEPLELQRALRLYQGVASGLAHVHRQGHVHRDIKPHNILVADAGTRDEYALLTDFGITRALDSSTVLTKGIIGTAAYMAPEILQWRPATPGSDQYSLACVLYEMLTGRTPYHDKELPAAHLHEPVPSARSLAPAIPPLLASAVERALAKDPDERHPSVREFAEAVAAGAAAPPPPLPSDRLPTVAVRSVAPERPRAPTGRPRAAVAAPPMAAPYAPAAHAPPPPIAPAAEQFPLERTVTPNNRSEWVLRWAARSLWGVWAALPLFNGGAWLHAALLTGKRRDFVFAALYTIPLLTGMVESAITGAEQMSGPLSALVVITWLGCIAHAMIERGRVRRDVVARRGRLSPMPR